MILFDKFKVKIWIKYFIPFSCIFLIITISLIIYFLKPQSPNIILITIDALRPDHLSCYGYKRNTSPNIDKLTEEGVMFSQVISQGPWTPPSIFSIITSMYPNIHGVYDYGMPINANITNLFEILKMKECYYMGSINGRGELAEFNFSSLKEYFDTFYPSTNQYILANEVSQNAIEWLRSNKRKKFFLWLFYLDPHAPYRPPSPYDKLYLRDEFAKEYNKHVPISNKTVDLYDGYGVIPKIAAVKDITDINYYISQYDGEIRFVDEQIGKVLNELKVLNLYDNTLIIISSDHGESMGEHNYYFVHGHGLYDEWLRVPLIIRHKSLPNNIIIDRQVQSIDIMPTILDIARKNVPEGLAGISLLPLIQKGKYPNIYAFSEVEGEESIRTENWKLIYNRESNGYQLYNLKDDPGELRNLVDERRLEFQLLQNKLHNWLNRTQPKAEKQKQILDEETRMKLRSLGYLQ